MPRLPPRPTLLVPPPVIDSTSLRIQSFAMSRKRSLNPPPPGSSPSASFQRSETPPPGFKKTRLRPPEAFNSHPPLTPLSQAFSPSLPPGLTQNTASRNTWEETIWQFRNKSLGELDPHPDQAKMSKLRAAHLIGGAYIHALGPDHLDNFIDRGNNPNLRVNPRPINQSHVAALAQALTQTHYRVDHESPIILMVSRAHIQPECLEKMCEANPRDPSAQMPLLKLVYPNPDELARVEARLFAGTTQQGDAWLSVQETTDLLARLHGLRAVHPRAVILNGAHRVEALVEIGVDILQRTASMRAQVEAGELPLKDISTHFESVARLGARTTYRVEVYDADGMPQELQTWLVRNEHTRPAMGMGEGEQAWWLSRRVGSLRIEAQQKGLSTLPEQANWAFATLDKELSNSVTPSKNTTHQKGDRYGPSITSRLFSTPLTTEMVLDTSRALNVFSNVLTRDMSIGMIQPGGARLCSRFWLDTLTLITIVNVSGAMNVSTCDTFNRDHPLVTHGYSSAIPLWVDMHIFPQGNPEYLQYYDQSFQDQFAKIYLASMDGTGHDSGEINWQDPDIILRARQTFDAMGSWISEKFPTQSWSMPLATSFKLYSRLPTDEGEPREAVFSPSSGLPCKQVYDLELKSQKNYREILILVDFLLEKTLPVWSVGTHPHIRSLNYSQWFQSSSFLCQIPMKCLQAAHFGRKAQALHQANRILSDYRLHSALHEAQDLYKGRIQALKLACSIAVGQGVKYPIFDTHPPTITSDPYASTARLELLKSLQSRSTTRETFAQIFKQHLILQEVTDADFWTDFPVQSWWDTWTVTEARHHLYANVLLGWAILLKHLPPLIHDALGSITHFPHILNVCRFLQDRLGIRSWWLEQHAFLTPDQIQVPPSQAILPEPLNPPNHAPSSPPAEATGRSSSPALVETPPPAATPRSPSPEQSPAHTNHPTPGSIPDDHDDHTSTSPPVASPDPKPSSREAEVSRRPRKSRHSQPDLGKQARNSRRRKDCPSPEGGHPVPVTPDAPAASIPHAEEAASPAIPSNETQATHVVPSQSSDSSTSSPFFAKNPIFFSHLEEHQAYHNPGYVYVPFSYDSTMPDYIFSDQLFNPQVSLISIKKGIYQLEPRVSALLSEIASARQSFREGVHAAAQLFTSHLYGNYLLESALAPLLASYKDTFTAHLAAIFARHLEMPESDALAQAMHIVSTDRLYDSEMKSSSGGLSGKSLSLDLNHTFPCGQQTQVIGNSQVYIGEIEDKPHEISIEAVQRYLGYLRAPRSHGRTEKESLLNGLQNSDLMIHKMHRIDTSQVYFNGPPEVDPPAPGTSWHSILNNHFDLTSLPIERTKLQSFHPTSVPLRSSFSTGDFRLPHAAASQSGMGERGEILPNAKRVIESCRTHWDQTVELDLVAYNTWKTSLEKDILNSATFPDFPNADPAEFPGLDTNDGVLGLHSSASSQHFLPPDLEFPFYNNPHPSTFALHQSFQDPLGQPLQAFSGSAVASQHPFQTPAFTRRIDHTPSPAPHTSSSGAPNTPCVSNWSSSFA